MEGSLTYWLNFLVTPIWGVSGRLGLFLIASHLIVKFNFPFLDMGIDGCFGSINFIIHGKCNRLLLCNQNKKFWIFIGICRGCSIWKKWVHIQTNNLYFWLLLLVLSSCVSPMIFLVMQDLLRDTDDNDLGPAISHFFNCFFGSCQAVGTKVSANGLHSRATKKVCPQKINTHGFLVTVSATS